MQPNTSLAALFAAALLASPIFAQKQDMPMMSLGQNATLSKLFGSTKSFSATVESVKEAKDKVTMPMEMAMLDGKLRMEIDMNKVKGRDFSPEQAAMMKQMGMDKMVIVSLPGQKTARYIFPGLESYAEMSASSAAASGDSGDKIEVKEIGKETVDGHPCVKNLVTVTDKDGQKDEATTWNATDLKSFPVKMEVPDKSGKMTMTFKNVKLTPPDAKLFEAPANFAKYSNMQEMMFGAMQKRFKQ